MLKYLRYEFDNWDDIYNYISDPEIPTLHGWWAYFEGPSADEMHLTNKHPLSDESGETITDKDFNEYIKAIT